MKVTIKYVIFFDNILIVVINYHNSQNFIVFNTVYIMQIKAPAGARPAGAFL